MYIDHVLLELHIDNEETRAVAYAFYKDLRGDLILNGLIPSAVAAAIVYMSCIATDIPKRQVDISWALNIADVLLRKYYGILKNYFGFQYGYDPDDKGRIPDENDLHYHTIWTTKRPIDIE